MAQDSTPFGPSDLHDNTSCPSPTPHHRARPSQVGSLQLPNGDTQNSSRPWPIRRCILRLDAFLGEWLSPSYFELITPPPESVMMLASAKADLLRRENYDSYPHFNHHGHGHHGHHHSSSTDSQGQLWSPTSARSNPFATPTNPSADPFDNISSIGNSLSSNGNSSKKPVHGYVAPVPHYAVNNNNTIPPGYVAHARDACIDVDYQWDSMRSPLDWGSGGSFPEEWVDMHRRFRKGVQSLVDWYTASENPTKMVTRTVGRYGRRDQPETPGFSTNDDVETEAIVVMVSHGAGCNALIGAITHQPVLADVGMTSLTVAERKPMSEESETADGPHRSPVASPGPSQREREKTSIHHQYDLKLFANTDHLRSPSPLTSPRSHSVTVASTTGGRYAPIPNPFEEYSFNDRSETRNTSANTALSNIRSGSNISSNLASSAPRFTLNLNSLTSNVGGITVGSGVTSFGTRAPDFGRGGLWSPTTTTSRDDDTEDDFMVLDFGNSGEPAQPSASASNNAGTHTSAGQSSGATSPPPEKSEREQFQTDGSADDKRTPSINTTMKSFTPIGLTESPVSESSNAVSSGDGGSAIWPGDDEVQRDHETMKRRWTVTERGQ